MSGKPMAKLEENNQMFVPELVCENLRCCLAGMESSNASDRKLQFSRPTSPVRYVALFFGDVYTCGLQHGRCLSACEDSANALLPLLHQDASC